MLISANKIIISAFAAFLVAFAIHSAWVSVFLFLVIGLTIGAIIIGITVSFYTYTCVKRKPRMSSTSISSSDLPLSFDVMKDFVKICGQPCRNRKREDISASTLPSDGTTRCLPVVYGRMVDAVLQQIIDLVLRDYVAHWLQDLCAHPEIICQELKEDLWKAVKILHERLSNVDQTQLVACEMTARVTAHFERLRLAHTAAMRVGGPAVVHIAPYVANSSKEELFLRNLSEMVVVLLLPDAYATSHLLRLLAREVLACAILQPVINMLCDPDFINQKIIAYIRQQKTVEAKKQPIKYAANYEEFLRTIKDCDDLETLKHIRYSIVIEIMQANVQQLKAKENQQTHQTGDANEVRKLNKYINQLTNAKKQCESRLRSMGWRIFTTDETGSEVGSFEAKQTLPLLSVLESEEGRTELKIFLQQHCTSAPTPEGIGSPVAFLEYWITAEKMRQAPRQLWHQLAQELYYTHVQPPSSPLKVDKAVKKRMESFLLGDQGPEVFYEVQEDVVQKLQKEYYSSFVASDQYQRMLIAMEETASSDHGGNSEDNQLSADSGHGSDSSCVTIEHNYSRLKLAQLEEKLLTKRQALQALRTSLKPESKILLQLDREVERLDGERRQLEAHLARTETWGEHLGRWRVYVQSVELPDEKEPPQFVLVVHVLEDELDTEAISTGWVVLRKLTDFLELHRKLSQLDAEVKNLELPTLPVKFPFTKTVDKSSLEKSKLLIQRYLEFILEDDRLNQSEALYTFLSPSSDHLKQVAPSPKKNKFSLSTLFKSGSAGSSSGGSFGGSGTGGLGDDSEDEELLLEEEGRILDGPRSGQDGIAEPLYALLGEVFDLRGLFRWLRRSLITFVQITYGRTITRQVRETVAWIFSEPMLHFYAQVFIGSWWSHGKLAPPVQPRTQQERVQTRMEARLLFVSNVPEILSNLVGHQYARRGALKVFDALQETKLNKQLFYDLLEVVLYEIFAKELK